jgi:DNA-binding NtrC family response regulator
MAGSFRWLALSKRRNDRMLNPQHPLKRLNFRCALVIVEADALRSFIVQLLRKQGWLVHGIRQVQQASNILVQIPYELIIIDSELPDMSDKDFIRILHNAREWRAIKLVVITSSPSAGFAVQTAEPGAFLAKKSSWEDDICAFLSTYDQEPAKTNAYG